MSVVQPQSPLRFGLFELNVQSRELYRDGVRIRLAPKPFDLLAALTEQPGTVITREALQQRLWPPDTFVDYEHGLNKTVRKLREALRDSAESPRYIETVQRTGYRFIAPVSRQATPSPPVQVARPLSLDELQPVSSDPTPAAVSHSSTQKKFAVVAVASALLLALTTAAIWRHTRRHSAPPAPATATVEPRAQEVYLHGRSLWFGEHALASSDYFKRAIEYQPDYGPAWAGMAMYYGASLIRGRLDPAEGLALLDETAGKAIKLAPDLSDAHLAECGAIFLKTWQYTAANVECNRALQLDPKAAEVYHLQSKMLAALHREEDALALQRTSSSLDPLSRPWALGQALMQARRFDEALSESRARLDAFPHDATLLRLLAAIYRYRGNDTESNEYLEQSYRADSDEPSAAGVRNAFRSGGAEGVTRWHLQRLLQQSSRRYVSPFEIALAYVRLNDQERAVAMLTKALDQRSPQLLWVRCYPEFDVLNTDPRYQQILQKLPSH